MYSRVLIFGIWSFVVTHFNAIVLTFCDWFQRCGNRPHDWGVILLHTIAIVKIAELSQVLSFNNALVPDIRRTHHAV